MSGDRTKTSRAPKRWRRCRRAGGVARLAAGLSLAATGFALASISTALADPAADHGKPADGQSADTQAETAAKTFPGSRPADASRPNARARNGRPATLPTTDPAALPWDEIAVFMRQHSPLKWERWDQFDRAYSSRGAGGPGASRRAEMRQKLEEGIRDQYAQLKKIESADADEYQLMVRRVELEDKVFGAQAEFRRGAGDAAKQALATQQIKQHVRALLALQDEVKLHRLEHRKAELARQSDQVDKQLAVINERIAQGPKEQQVDYLAFQLLRAQPPALWDGPGPGRLGGGGGQPRRDGAPPDGREPRSGHLPPTTNRSGDEGSKQAEKSPAPADQR